MDMNWCEKPAYRVEQAQLETDPARIPQDAGLFSREVAALAKAYFAAIDAGDVDAMLGHLDRRGFDLHVQTPDAHLANEDAYRDWYAGISRQFSRLHHTVVRLTPILLSSERARARLSVHSETDLRDPARGDFPRASATLDILWELTRSESGWVIASQRADPVATPPFSTTRAREFAVRYLQALDRRDLDALLAVLVPPGELNIALNQGLIIEDFPEWFRSIDAAFVNSVHRVQGLVALENEDGTIDVHLKIHFTADRRSSAPDEPDSVDFSVKRIWTLRRGPDGGPRLISQRRFAPMDLGMRVDPVDVAGAVSAVRRGDNEVVRDWLRRGGDPNAHGPDGFTLFLAAAAAGNIDTLRMLLIERVRGVVVDPDITLKDPSRPEDDTGILAAHLASQKGDAASTLFLLSRYPEHLHARIEVNRHTPLLQAAFYGHVGLATALVEKLGEILPPGADVDRARARLFVETTLRGLNATAMARQFGNAAMVRALEPHDVSTEQARAADTLRQLETLPAGRRHPEAGTPGQAASERVVEAIAAGLAEVATLDEACRDAAITRILEDLRDAVQNPHFLPDRLAGDLLQTPLVVAVTGTNANPGVARLRKGVVQILLAKGADPDIEERYPMAVDAVIRAAVFNHFDILKSFEAAMPPGAMTRALNCRPAVNGLTALHDSVLRAATGSRGYLEQIRWARGLGALADIPDHTGRTQNDLAAAAFLSEGQQENAPDVWEALNPGVQPPRPFKTFTYDTLTFLTIPARVADKGLVWRTLAGAPDVVVRSIGLDGPNPVSAEVVQNHDFGTAIMNRQWPDGRPVDASELQAFSALTRGTPFLPIMRFEKPDPYIKQLNGAGLFGALLVNPESPHSVREMLRDVYFPQRPGGDVAQRPSTAEHPLGKRAVGADSIAQRTFAEYPRMMDMVNLMYIGGISFSQPAAPGVLEALPDLKRIGVKMIEVDHAGIRASLASSHGGEELDHGVCAETRAIEDAARRAGIVLSGAFRTEGEIRHAFERGYRHITTITECEARQIAWRSWLPAGSAPGDRAALGREMPHRPPNREFNDLRRALAAGELVVFGALTTPNLATAACLASSGILNAVAIEREHGTWSTEETLRHIVALRDRTNVIVRTCDARDTGIAAFVRAGVAALIATAVRDADEARVYLEAVRAANVDVYGNASRGKWATPVVMMETEGAAEQAEDIVAMLKAHDGVCHPGPLDLSASLGAAWGTDRYETALRRIETAARASGVPLAGVRNTLEEALAHGLGMVLAPVGMDAGALNAGIMGTNPLQSLQNDNTA